MPEELDEEELELARNGQLRDGNGKVIRPYDLKSKSEKPVVVPPDQTAKAIREATAAIIKGQDNQAIEAILNKLVDAVRGMSRDVHVEAHMPPPDARTYTSTVVDFKKDPNGKYHIGEIEHRVLE